MTPKQGEIWRWEPEDLKPRPVLILTRDEVIAVLSDVVVAPVTRTMRDIPTEVHLGKDCGLPVECCASFDNVFTASRAHLVRRVGELPDERRHEICDAMKAVIDC